MIDAWNKEDARNLAKALGDSMKDSIPALKYLNRQITLQCYECKETCTWCAHRDSGKTSVAASVGIICAENNALSNAQRDMG